MSLRPWFQSLVAAAVLWVAVAARADDRAAAPPAAPAVAGTESSAPVAGRALQRRALLDALRGGGYVVYFRHTKTDFSKLDGKVTDYGDCSQQRMLSDQGRDDARTLGRRVRALKLPLDRALASPYCRTMEHAKLAFGTVEPRHEIRESDGGHYPGLRRLLAMPVRKGELRWIVGHGTPFRSIAGPPHLAEGEAAVIAPEGDRWTVVARLTLDDWAQLGTR